MIQIRSNQLYLYLKALWKWFIFCNFLKALAPLGELKDGLEMFGLADVQHVSIAARKDLIARLPLSLVSLPILTEWDVYAFRQQHVFLIKV